MALWMWTDSHKSRCDPSSDMCLIAITVTPALDSGYRGLRKSGLHLILQAETLTAAIARACVADNLGI